MTSPTSVRVLGTVLSALLLSSLGARAETPDEHWAQFRKVYPFHHQAVAMSAPDRAGNCTVIVAEPPPHVPVTGTAAVLGEELKKRGWDGGAKVDTKTHRVGHDGWVKDLVLTVGGVNDGNMKVLVAALHDYLFGSAYGAEALPLPAVKPDPIVAEALDRRVSAADLSQWLTAGGLAFGPLAGGPPVAIADVLEKARSGVFVNAEKGLVLWAFPLAADLAEYRRSARQFAVTSDLILGAAGTDKQLVLIGRKRLVPMANLPPLRVETLVLLASVKTDALVQSYERTRIFAGRFDDKWDWAPILLSPELINTEYGSLLNITDQLLKGWTQGGEVEYEEFEAYPKPAKFPFDGPLSRVLNTARLTFNWNTAGAGYTVAKDGVTWYALNRTGALPITYIPEGAGADARARVAAVEQKAYDYYARSGDPNLARVVSYAGAYQLFRHYRPAKGAKAADTPAQQGGYRVLADKTGEVLKKVAEADKELLDETARGIGKRFGDDGGLGGLFLRRQLEDVRDLVKEYHAAAGGDGLAALAGCLANPRAIDPDEFKRVAETLQEKLKEKEKPDLAALLGAFEDGKSKALVMHLLLATSRSEQFLIAFASPKAVKEAYAAAFKDQPDGWVRTPSIVVSRAIGETAGAVGGHSLGAKVPVFEPGKVEPGKVKVTERGGKLIVEYNPADFARLPEISRKTGQLDAARGRKLADIEQSLAKELAEVPPPPPREPAKALFPAEIVPTEKPNSLWREDKKGPTQADKDLIADLLPGAGRGPVMVIERDGNNYRVLRGDDTRAVERVAFDSVLGLFEYLHTVKDATGLGSRPLHLTLKGFNDREAQGLLANFSFQSKASQPPSFFARVLNPRQNAKAPELFREYDFSKGKVNGKSVETKPGEGRWKGYTEVTFVAEVPSQKASNPSLFMRFRMFFSGAVEGAQQLATKMIAKVFGGQAKTPGEFDAAVLDAVNEFRADIKQQGLRVHIELGEQGGDMLFDMIEVNRVGRRRDVWRG